MTQDRAYPRVVDMHCHLVVPAAEALARPHLPAEPETAQRYQSAETREVSRAMAAACRVQLTDARARLADMDAMGVDLQVVSPSPGHYAYWADADLGRALARVVNDTLAEQVGCHPSRMVALGTVPLQHPALAVEELRRCVRELGMRGVQISTNVAGAELADPRFHPFLAAAEELGAVLFLHPTGFTHGERLAANHLNNLIGNPLDTTVAIAHLIYSGTLDRFSGLKLCLAHGGGFLAAYAGRFDHAHRVRSDCQHCRHAPSHYLRRMHFDTVVFDPEELEQLARRYGASQLVLGTDYPYDMGERDPIGLLGRTRLSEEERQGIAGLNAARLLGLPDPTSKDQETRA